MQPEEKRFAFVSWTPHSRARDLSARLGAAYLVPARFVLGWWWPLRYGVQAVTTIVRLLSLRPSVVLFTNPPCVSGVACLIGARLARAQCWADCHSGAYNDARWTRFARLNEFVLRRCSGAIFHNVVLATEQEGAAPRSVTLSVYSMRDRSAADSWGAKVVSGRPLALAVCSHALDEPIEAIIAAAELLPDVDFALTGSAPAGMAERLPANVRATGWLSDDDFDRTLSEAAVIMSLTTREATMQNGLIEALEHRRPVVTSDSQALRGWARGIPGVLLVDNRARSIADAVGTVVADQGRWDKLANQGHEAARRRSEAELDRFMEAVGS